MAFTPQTINKELDMANLAKHNANYSAIKTELDAHDAHIAAQTAHGSTSAATAGKIMQRDSAGRAKVAAPAAADDIARKAEVDAVQSDLNAHKADGDVHLSAADRAKFDGIEPGAEPNQNAFAKVNNVEAGAESDALTIAGGTGITVSTNPGTKTVTVTATGDATPGPHGESHDIGGADPIPDLVALRSEFDALTPADIGAETPAGAQAKVDALGAVTVKKTLGDVVLYVDAQSGSDSNAGDSSSSALRSISAAIGRLPQILNHNVTVIIAEGSYPETVLLRGFSGGGLLRLIGDSVVSGSRLVERVIVENSSNISVQGIKANSTAFPGFEIINSLNITLDRLAVIDPSEHRGVSFVSSVGRLISSIIHDRGDAIFASACSTLLSDNNTGSGNAVGLSAHYASTIGKFNSQPGADVAEQKSSGGEIR